MLMEEGGVAGFLGNGGDRTFSGIAQGRDLIFYKNLQRLRVAFLPESSAHDPLFF